MTSIRISILALGLLSIAGNATAIDLNAICCDGGYEYRHRNQWDADNASKDMAARLAALEKERNGSPMSSPQPRKKTERSAIG